MNKLMTMSAAFALATTMTVGVASAATVVTNGSTHVVGAAEGEFTGIVVVGAGQTGGGDFQVQFDSAVDPLDGTVLATIGGGQLGQFNDLMISWESVPIAGNSLASLTVVDGTNTLGTTFTGANINQILRLSWSSATEGAGFDFEVSTVPLPAGLVLLLSGLLGLGFLGRARKAA